MGEKKRAEIDEQLKDYIVEWRVQREKEEKELISLKEKQVKRKAIRQEQEQKLEAQKKAEKKRRLEETERKRQALMKAETAQRMTGRQFTITKKSGGGDNDDPAAEFKKPKEQLEEEKKVALQIRVKALQTDGMNIDRLKAKAQEMWDQIVKLETEKYDLEDR